MYLLFSSIHSEDTNFHGKFGKKDNCYLIGCHQSDVIQK
jgi:hypothetical protein